MKLWSELLGFGLAIGFSPLHIGLLLLLLLGASPLRRGGLLVATWLLVAGLEMAVLLRVGHGLLLSMSQGTGHRTGVDLLAAGGLLALGLNTLLSRGEQGSAPPAWSNRLDGFSRLPMLPLLALSSALEAFSPDDLFLYVKASAAVLAADLGFSRELLVTAVFCLSTALLLLLPLLAVLLLGQTRVQPLLQSGKEWLYRKADLIVAGVSLTLAGYFIWQGVEGLRLML
ncbi:MAG: GAP family protein [Synechococcaceae cyanobacterium]|nr:GAP family protein [Synechococcaceae cyanobacterium]